VKKGVQALAAIGFRCLDCHFPLVILCPVTQRLCAPSA
jgi:hypothetical protein